MVEQRSLPVLNPEIITLVGSHYRETDISPLQHIDVFLEIDSSLVDVHVKGDTLSLVTKDNVLSTCVDDSLHVLPQKLVSALQVTFSQHFPATISSTGQSIKIQLEKEKFFVRITPSFAWDHSFFVPQEKSELLWRRVSPYKEKAILDQVNQLHNGNIKSVIRCVKLWNELRNNESFRNYHLEAIAYTIFREIPTATHNVMEALELYVNQMPRYIYNCPDPTGLDTPIHTYLPDNIDQWYLFMNRIAELKTAIKSGEKSLVALLKI